MHRHSPAPKEIKRMMGKEGDGGLSGCSLNSMAVGKGKQSTADTKAAHGWHARVQEESG